MLVRLWGVALARPLLKLDIGGGLENDSREVFREINWSREAEARSRGFRPWLIFEESWSLDAEALSLWTFSSEGVSLRTGLAPWRLSRDADGRIVEFGRGSVDVGLGKPEVGRARGSLEGRGRPLARLLGVSSMVSKGHEASLSSGQAKSGVASSSSQSCTKPGS